MGNNAPGQGGIPGWGQLQQPQQPQAPQQPGWGAPPPQAPAPQPGWGQQAPQQPGWGAPPPQQPAPQPGWGTPPPQAPAPQPGWGAPPPQQPGWGAPAPQAAWNPAPAKSGNGCLKGCLIVGGILLALLIIGFIAISVLGLKLAGDMGIGANGEVKECPYVSNADLEKVLGKDATALPISGIADATIGQVLDRRVLKNADNCMLSAGSSSGSSAEAGAFGRIAKDSGNSSSKFDTEKKAADTGGYLGDSVSGLGDQAFCTTSNAEYPGVGVLVRKGNDLFYVSMLDASPMASDGSFIGSCEVAQQVAKLLLK